MKIISISGIIARWEMESESNVTPETLRKSLEEANGEDIRIDINSPGGNVSEGLEMYSMIKNYSGHTETRVVAMAASMGSVIALAGNKRTAEKTASYMIHNASGVTWGDYREVGKYAERLKAISGHLSNIYTDRTGIENSKIRSQMNEETWTYGEDLTDYGFEIVDSETAIDLESSKFQAHTRYDNYIAEMKARPEEHAKDIEKVAASLVIKPIQNNQTKPAPNAGNENNNEEKISVKNLEELKAQFPDLYAQAEQAGIEKHKDLVVAHITMGEAGNCMDLAVKNIKADNAITATVQAEYMAEGMKKRDISNRNEDEPENINTDGKDNGETTPEEQAAYEAKLNKKMGVKK
jgi:ATP-dependent protease ClpP protease subunit